ncbi:MAG: NAD-dependent succinate-semialdehyde dehydrogenase [Maribacter sp.]
MSITTINPATGDVLKSYHYMTDQNLKTTIEASHNAFLKWKYTTLDERAKIVKAVGSKLQDYKEKLSQLMTNEMGKLLAQSHDEVDLCSAICKYTAKNGVVVLQNEQRDLLGGGKGIITYSPIGVIYGIQPWNYPAYQVMRYAIVNIMAGNTVLLKHAENVTGTGKLLEEIFLEAGLPENVFRTLVISHDQSDTVIENEAVRGVTLTGSSKAGKIIAEKAGAELKKVVLELGSNDAYIVLDDADIDDAVEKAVRGRIYNNGETCIAAKRFVIVEAVYEKFKMAFVEAMKNVTIGNPNDSTVELGPIARADLRETLHDQVEESIKNGATILCGGEMPEGKGFYYPVTVLEHVKPGQPAYDDELFGPVASLIKARNEDDAMRIANDSRYGLGGGIFSKDEEKAKKLAEKHFDTGMVFINSFGIANPDMPFGGVKDSGYGREHGGFGIKEFVNVKSLILSDN